MTSYHHAYVEALVQLDALAAENIRCLVKQPGPLGRLHLLAEPECSNSWNTPEETVANEHVNAAQLLELIATYPPCSCAPPMTSLLHIARPLEAVEKEQLHWLAQTRHRRRTAGSEAPWPQYAILACPPEGPSELINDAVAAEAAQVREEFADLGDKWHLDMATTLRLAESAAGPSAVVGTRPTGTVSPKAPIGASANEVLQHHDQFRVWVRLYATDYVGAERALRFVDLAPGRYVRLANGQLLATLPEAIVALRRMRTERVVGYDARYTAAEVQEVLAVLPASVQLGEGVRALRASRA